VPHTYECCSDFLNGNLASLQGLLASLSSSGEMQQSAQHRQRACEHVGQIPAREALQDDGLEVVQKSSPSRDLMRPSYASSAISALAAAWARSLTSPTSPLQ